MWTSQVNGHHDKMARTKTHRTSQTRSIQRRNIHKEITIFFVFFGRSNYRANSVNTASGTSSSSSLAWLIRCSISANLRNSTLHGLHTSFSIHRQLQLRSPLGNSRSEKNNKQYKYNLRNMEIPQEEQAAWLKKCSIGFI